MNIKNLVTSNTMLGTLSEEVEVKVPINKAWDLYGTIKLGEIAKQFLENLEVIEGDGGVGTIIKVTFKPGSSEFSYYKEKYTMIDNEKRVRETETIEGGHLDFGFTLYRVRIEVKDNPNDESGCSCLAKTTIEYEVKEEAKENAKLATIQPFAVLMKLANDHLLSSS